MEHASKQQVPKFTITSFDTAHIALYHALIESILEDEDVMDEGVADKLKKRKPDNADQDEGATARSDQGLKRQRTRKGNETSKKTSEPISVQDSDYAKHDDVEFENTDMPMDQEEDLGKTYEQPNDEDVPRYDRYKKSRSNTSPDPKWNKGKSVDDRPEQCQLNDMAKATKPPLTFDELIHTPINFSAFVMNRLKIDNLTKEIFVGPAYNLLKGTCKSYVEFDYTMEECYRALFEQLHWNHPMGHCCPYDVTKPLPVQMTSQAFMTKFKAARYELKGIEDMVPNLWSLVNEWYGYGHLEEILVKRADKQQYTFKEGDFKRLHLNDTEDMLLLIVQNKLNNLDVNFVVHLAASLRMFARRTVIQERVEDLQLGVESYQK
nr:hypothetical protein [Tanacetum cinerariifolium]